MAGMFVSNHSSPETFYASYVSIYKSKQEVRFESIAFGP